MATKDTDDRKDADQDGDISLDMSQAAVKKMIADARERGYITYDQLNAVLPPDQVSSDQIEDVMSMLSEMGIQPCTVIRMIRFGTNQLGNRLIRKHITCD